MQAEQPTKMCKLLRKMRVKVGTPYNRFKSPVVIAVLPSQGSIFVAVSFVSLCCDVLVMRPPLYILAFLPVKFCGKNRK